MKAIVTGASRGIGFSICKELSSLGYQVVGLCRNLSDEVSSGWMAEMNSDCRLLSLDVTDASLVTEFLENLIKDFEPYLLVNNAGITSDSFFHKMSASSWDSVINTNLRSIFYVTQPIYKKMIEIGEGRIINIASVNGQKGQAGQVNYCAAKAGVHGFTKALAQEAARFGITVNTISPGYTSTDMIMNIRDEIRDSIRDTIPLKRFAEASEIAKTVAFIASRDASYITGADVSVNGGLFIS